MISDICFVLSFLVFFVKEHPFLSFITLKIIHFFDWVFFLFPHYRSVVTVVGVWVSLISISLSFYLWVSFYFSFDQFDDCVFLLGVKFDDFAWIWNLGFIGMAWMCCDWIESDLLVIGVCMGLALTKCKFWFQLIKKIIKPFFPFIYLYNNNMLIKLCIKVC